MKPIILATATMWLFACKPMHTSSSSNIITTNYKNSNSIHAKNNPTILLGKQEPAAFLEAPFNEWFTPNFQQYVVDSSLIAPIKNAIKNKVVEIYLGTWCGDSKREVPRMLKILQAANFDRTHFTLVFVNNTAEAYKQSPQHEEQGKNIIRVPTFIVYQGKIEMGRIIESPVESLEKDLLKILQSAPYQPNYHNQKQ